MDRLVGIDYGKKRTGIAVSDPLRIFASPLETVPTTKIMEFLKDYSDKEKVEKFVVGYPINMDNKPSEAARYVDTFLKQLKKKFPDIEIVLEDERFTSVLAFQSLIDSGVKKKGRRDKSAVDKVSAALILQTFMNRKN
ncbi:MAG: Holliday junction resolvase RuvX [Bacteroidales bacterium]